MGLYYLPTIFGRRLHEREEYVRVDTGLLAVTTKHLYFHGSRKRFRVWLENMAS
jgi:hypothetical protein